MIAAIWFACAFVFLTLVAATTLLPLWLWDDRRQAEATHEALARTKPATDNSHIMDVV